MSRNIFISEFLKKRFGYRVHKVAFRIGNTCPNRDGSISRGGCIFCNGEELIPASFRQGMSIREQLIQGMEVVKRRYNAKGFIAYLQDNTATYGDESRIMGSIREAISIEGIVGISIATRADCISENFYKFIQEVSEEIFLIIEIGVQSINEETLRMINRGHNLTVVEDTFKRLSKYNVHSVAHIILGLPNDTDSDVRRLSVWLNENNVSGVKVHNIVILRDTILAEMFHKKQFVPPDRDSLLRLYSIFFDRLDKEIVVHRLTTDANPHYIVAPEYARHKDLLLNDIRKILYY